MVESPGNQRKLHTRAGRVDGGCGCEGSSSPHPHSHHLAPLSARPGVVDLHGQAAAPKLHRLWLINKLAVNHMPININSMFVHRTEDVPGPASLAGLMVKPACGDQAKGNQVESLALWPSERVFHCPRNEGGAKREVES